MMSAVRFVKVYIVLVKIVWATGSEGQKKIEYACLNEWRESKEKAET